MNRANRFLSAVALGLFLDRKSTRLNSSHSQISYAVFCLKKKKHSHQNLVVHVGLLLAGRAPLRRAVWIRTYVNNGSTFRARDYSALVIDHVPNGGLLSWL